MNELAAPLQTEPATSTIGGGQGLSPPGWLPDIVPVFLCDIVEKTLAPQLEYLYVVLDIVSENSIEDLQLFAGRFELLFALLALHGVPDGLDELFFAQRAFVDVVLGTRLE